MRFAKYNDSTKPSPPGEGGVSLVKAVVCSVTIPCERSGVKYMSLKGGAEPAPTYCSSAICGGVTFRVDHPSDPREEAYEAHKRQPTGSPKKPGDSKATASPDTAARLGHSAPRQLLSTASLSFFSTGETISYARQSGSPRPYGCSARSFSLGQF